MSNELSRRDVLKLLSIAPVTLALDWTRAGRWFARSLEISNLYPELKKENLPSFYREILDCVLLTCITKEGVLQIEQGANAEKKDVPIVQTKLNKRILKLSERNPNFLFVADQIGLAWHWFGDLDPWIKIFAPNGTAREYVDNGFGGGTSAMFLVGDEIPGNGGATDKASIAQCELPTNKGIPAQSAHILPVDRNDYESRKQYFAFALNELGKKYFSENQYTYSILQRMYNGGPNTAPNRQIIGVEILGSDFDNPKKPSIYAENSQCSICLHTYN